jgi:hypothetical protein
MDFTRAEADFVLHLLSKMTVKCVDDDAEDMTSMVRGLHNKFSMIVEDYNIGAMRRTPTPYQPLPGFNALDSSLTNLRETREKGLKIQCSEQLRPTG